MRITLFFYLCTEQKPNKMDIRRIIFLLLTVSFTFSLPAQNIDINTLKTINKWKVHGTIRQRSDSARRSACRHGTLCIDKERPADAERCRLHRNQCD